jgi:DNA primase
MTSSPVQKIKEILSIEDVVSSYIKLEKVGPNLKAKCPFHNEKTPSFFISSDRGTYYCFGCSKGGDIFSFVEEFEGLDFKGALKLLADRAGVTLEVYNKDNKEVEETKSEKDRLYKIMEEATLYFENNLKTNPEVLNYLKSRGLNEKSIKDFRIGYAILDWRTLYTHLSKKGFSDMDIEKAGLIKKPTEEVGKIAKGYYDRFRGRVIFPISDSSGRVIAFSGRIFVDVPSTSSGQVVSQAKYLNSPETPIFKKSAILYGLDKAKESIKKNNFSILVEGQFDLVLSHQAGFRNTVATSGTALANTDRLENNMINNLGLIRRLSSNIVFIFDADNAGFNASLRATPFALALFSDMNVKATEIPDGMDPADLISKKGPDAWKELIRNSKHIIEFILDKILSNNSDKLKIKLEIDKKIVPLIDLINNPIKKSHFISLVSSLSGIREDDIRDRLKKIEEESKYEKVEIKEKEISLTNLHREDYINRKLLGIILWQETLSEKNLNTDEVLKEIEDILQIKKEDFLEQFKDSKQDLIFEAEVFYGGGGDIEKDTKELLSNLKEEFFKKQLEDKMRELNIAERDNDIQRSAEILKDCQILNTKIQDIKNSRK